MGKFSKWIWRGVTVVIFIYTAVLTVRNLITVVKVHHRIARLEEQRDHFRERIAEDSTMLSRLKYRLSRHHPRLGPHAGYVRLGERDHLRLPQP